MGKKKFSFQDINNDELNRRVSNIEYYLSQQLSNEIQSTMIQNINQSNNQLNSNFEKLVIDLEKLNNEINGLDIKFNTQIFDIKNQISNMNNGQIKLNIGGKIFTTKRSTLSKFSNYFSILFESGKKILN